MDVNSDTKVKQQEQLAALEQLVVDNAYLEELEVGLAEYNIFEAIGMIHQEIRHSAFLAFLLDPFRNHRLGDWFLKNFLKKALAAALLQKRVSPFEGDIADLSQCEISTEWRNIDILVHDPVNKIVAAIENKVFAHESKGQLTKYHKTVENEFKGYRPIFIFLTPDGRPPLDEKGDADWISVDYDLVIGLLEQAEKRKSTLSEAVRITMAHYITMVRRHIMKDNDIDVLCKKIYREHRQAMNLILEHRPDLQTDLHDFLKGLLEKDQAKDHALVLVDSNKGHIRFIPKQLKGHFKIDTTGEWTNSGEMVLFWFDNQPTRLSIKATMGPGDAELREAIFKHASNSEVLVTSRKSVTEKYAQLFKVDVLRERDYKDSDFDQMTAKITTVWNTFRKETMGKLINALLEVKPITPAAEESP